MDDGFCVLTKGPAPMLCPLSHRGQPLPSQRDSSIHITCGYRLIPVLIGVTIQAKGAVMVEKREGHEEEEKGRLNNYVIYQDVCPHYCCSTISSSKNCSTNWSSAVSSRQWLNSPSLFSCELFVPFTIKTQLNHSILFYSYSICCSKSLYCIALLFSFTLMVHLRPNGSAQCQGSSIRQT